MLLSSQTVMADKLLESGYFNIETHTDHFTVKVLVADLVGRDSWMKDGYIRAYVKEPEVHYNYVEPVDYIDIARVYTFDQDGNGLPMHRIKAQSLMEGATVILDNFNYTKLDHTEKEYSIFKQKDYDYPQAELSIYWGPEMAGKEWYIMYYAQRDTGSSWSYKKLGWVDCRGDLGRNALNAGNYEITRTDAKNFTFKTPALPTNNCSNEIVKQEQKHIGWYIVKSTYTLFDNTTISARDSVECAPMATNHTIKIPNSVGNYKRVDMDIEAHDVYKSGIDKYKDKHDEGYYYHKTTTFNKSNAYPSVPVPGSMSGSFDQFGKKISLHWTGVQQYGDSYKYIANSKPYIYRIKTDKTGEPLSGEGWSLRGHLKTAVTTGTMNFTDNGGVSYNQYYKYRVVNIPDEWVASTPTVSITDDVLNSLGSNVTESCISTEPYVKVNPAAQDSTVEKKVKLNISYSRIPKDCNPKGSIQRCDAGNNNWKEIGTFEAKPELDPGEVVNYVDETATSNLDRYRYKVVISLNSGENVYESDATECGLISGTTVEGFTCSKGTHQKGVVLQWKADQSGTANTNFVISRRIVGEDDDAWQDIHTTSGTADNYTWQDNSANPGFYYDYRVMAYSGNLADNTKKPSSMTDVGFCQTTGTITGRITYANGNSAVDNVRVTLDAGGDNPTDDYSKQVEGVSRGIYWNADNTANAKLFKKANTVQMFVRPDSVMNKGILGTIPGMGHFLLEKDATAADNKTFKLQMKSEYSNTYKVATCYTEKPLVRAVIVHHNKYQGTISTINIGGHDYNLYNIDDIEHDVWPFTSQWKQDGFTEGRVFTTYGTIQGELGIYFFIKRQPVTDHSLIKSYHTVYGREKYDLGITLPANEFSLLNLLKDDQGNLTVKVGEQTSTSKTSIGPESTYDLSEEITVLKQVPFDVDPASEVDAAYLNSKDGTVRSWDIVEETLAKEVATLPEGSNLYDDYIFEFSVGGAWDATNETAFHGNISEVRVWDHVLNAKEESNYNDRTLSGYEKGLQIYWPLNESVGHLAFDASCTNDYPNGRHATVGDNIQASKLIPTTKQLSRYGVTDDQGNYVIRGIPFTGSGTSYTITPSKGVHSFEPLSRSAYISANSLTQNNYDFSDKSAFVVKGQIFYENTNIPVDSVRFKVDGEFVEGKHGPIMTDTEGKYEISVPIGNHRIEAYREGHKLDAFPQSEKDTYNFNKPEVVNFFDHTLVNVTGRINSGFADKDAPLGFGRSVNRIGQAELKLSLGREANSSFNYVVNDQGEGNFGTTPINVASATPSIASTAYRGAATASDNQNTHYIYIKTDAKTGEFSALLPPLNYKVESIRFPNDATGDQARYNNLPFFTNNLPMINASLASEKALKADTLEENGTKQVYQYTAKFVHQLRNNVEISVVQSGAKEKDAFGEEQVEAIKLDNTKEMVNAVNYSGNSFSYAFGYPLFLQDETYTMTIHVKESNYNVDTKKVLEEIPEDAEIYINNEASASTTVSGETMSENGETFEPGKVYQSQTIKAQPDKDGDLEYSFAAGYPNVVGNYLRNLNISVTVGNRTTVWQAPNKNTTTQNALEMIVLGGVLTGTNYITKAPDFVDMVLRRPPGSRGVASWTVDSVRCTSEGYKDHDAGSNGGQDYASIGPKIKATYTFMPQEIEWRVLNNTKNGKNHVMDTTRVTGSAKSYQVKEKMTTPSGGTYTQNDGDTYIGRSTNMLFGRGDRIGVYKQTDGSNKIDKKPSLCVGREFSTTFVYSQAYIEQTLIPNWKQAVKNLLVTVNDPLNDDEAKIISGQVTYYTKYKEGDARFGLSNADKAFTEEERDAAKGWPSYRIRDGRSDAEKGNTSVDSIQYCLNQIYVWQQWIAKNEEDKLAAFANDGTYLEKNYSIAGGTSITHSSAFTKKQTAGNTFDYTTIINSETNLGVLWNEVGDYATILHNEKTGTQHSSDTTTTVTKAIDWTISDAEPTTALSVNVYQSPRTWGPIFRTLGGQTSNPYEGATYTKYYQTGVKLDEATMRVEKPEMRLVSDAIVTNVPSGSAAQFKLQLSNASETNTTCEYVLECKDGSNPNGAKLMMDGTSLSNGKEGRKFKLKGGESIEKTLLVSQSDRTINDYENLTLVFKSGKDTSTVSQPALISVHFIPASTPVEMSVSHTTVNSYDYAEHKGLVVTLSKLDRTDSGLKGVRVRYRRKGYSSWTIAKAWQMVKSGETPEQGLDPLPSTDPFTTVVAFPEDGVFELQAQTFGMYGPQELTFETPAIEITQDIKGPKVLGSTSPIGTVNFINRNDIHVNFNEAINVNALSQSDNFTITGDLNNTAFSGDKTTNPDVALQLDGNQIGTQANFLFDNSDLAMDMWLYRQADGNIVSVGTDANQLSLFTENGIAKVRVGGSDASHIVASNVQLPADKWIYLALSYKHNDSNDKGTLSAIYADADHDSPVDILKDAPTNDINLRGRLIVGGPQMKGRMRDLTLWNDTRDVQQLYTDREKSKAAYMPGLVGYWHMDEGYGKTVNDKAHSRDMAMTAESWYINNDNRAAKLTAEEMLDIDISTFAPQTTDNYALELWFRADQQDGNGNASLIDLPNCLRLGFKDSKLTVKSYQRHIDEQGVESYEVTLDDEVLSEQNLIDNNWHHLALNVRRGSSAITYVDGAAVKTLPESSIPALGGSNLYVGKGFTGSIDDVRIWNAALESKNIADRRHERLDSTYAGLIGYFPFESIHRTMSGTVTTEFSLYNFGDKKMSKLTASGVDKEHNLSASSPALLPISQRMRLADVEYNFTASEKSIYFSLPDDILPRMDGSDFTFRVANVKDLSGNVSEPIEWTLHCDFSTLKLTLDEEEVSKPRDQKGTFTVNLQSTSNIEESYEFVNLPTWLTVSNSIGTVGPSGKTLTFTIAANVPIGHYTTYIYVKDRLNIIRSQRINLTVTGNEPDWYVDESKYASNMTVTGQIYVGNKILEYEDTEIGAFDLWGNCIGVAHPEYVKTRDAYYVNMVIYGDPIEKPDPHATYENEHKVIFQLYDSSTGITYPWIDYRLPDGSTNSVIDFSENARYGSYDKPVIFLTNDYVKQERELNKGWNWMSFYLKTEEGAQMPVNYVFKTVLPYLEEVKDHNYAAMPDETRESIVGSLHNIVAGKMYKVRMNAFANLSLFGQLVDVETTPQTIQPEWNWIGSLARYVMSPDKAFADLGPEKGDLIKSRTAFAEYNGQTWEGQLQEIKPGEGYLYHSKATAAKTFHYPKLTPDMASAPARRAAGDEELHWTVENSNHYSDNMTILATLRTEEGEQLMDAEVAAFIDEQCRGSIKGENGYYFLTVLGNPSEDNNKYVNLKAWVDGVEYDITIKSIFFSGDANYGSFSDGVVQLVLGTQTGIRNILSDDEEATWYDLSGRKLNGKPTKKGVFIRNGKKEIVK